MSKLTEQLVILRHSIVDHDPWSKRPSASIMASHYPPTVPQTEAKQDTGPPELLTTLLANYKSFDADEYSDKKRERPFVTLTFAQSNDGKIAGAHGKQLILSGKESMVMTHWYEKLPSSNTSCKCVNNWTRLRTMHDGIMVGIGTALNDDPQLNSRPKFSS